MGKYLLIILILVIDVETGVVFGQLITISGVGRKITSRIPPGNGMASVLHAKGPGYSVQYTNPKKNGNFSLQTGLKQVMLVCLPLKEKHSTTTYFLKRFHPILPILRGLRIIKQFIQDSIMVKDSKTFGG